MKKGMIFLATLAVAFYFSFIPAMAQHGRGAGGNSGGGGSMGMPGGMGSQGGHEGMGQGNRPEMGGPQMGHPEKGSEGRMGGEQKGTHAQETQTGKKPTVADQLTRNEQLTSKLQGILPAGTNVQDAATGFKNLGEFVAAAHVSHNLGIPFTDLKAKMATGTSLGDAIHTLKPDVDHNAEAKKAKAEAAKDMKESRAKKGSKEPVS